MEDNTARWGFGTALTDNLYVANGITGEIRRLLTGAESRWRVSKDGRFIGFLYGRRNDFITIYLFDVTAERIVSQFEWRTNRPIANWSILRFDTIFIIRADFENGYTVAEAELDPATMVLQTIWDITDPNNIVSPSPNRLIEGRAGGDDVMVQDANPNIRLRR